jgi:CPA2 family monovalent cation:H+ antiporter-2
VEHTAVTVLEVGAILLAAAFAGWVARRLALPAIVGYLAVGIAVSPFTPGYVADGTQVSLFAEVGAILLLFEVGIEVDLGELRRDHPAILWAAPLQMAITFVASVAVFAWLGLDLTAAALLGLAIAMSSSVVVVNITRSRRRTTERETEHLLVGWSGAPGRDRGRGGRPAARGHRRGPADRGHVARGRRLCGADAARLAAACRACSPACGASRPVPRGRVATGLAIAGAGALLMGIPLALAAFVAGLAITEGPVSKEARRRLLPFRDLFAIFFFVAIGTLIDPTALGRGLGWLVVCLALVIGAKSLVIFGLARVAKLPASPGQLAVGLGQVGEFGFVLATVAVARGVLPSEVYAALLAAVAISIAASSIGVRSSGRWCVEATAQPRRPRTARYIARLNLR